MRYGTPSRAAHRATADGGLVLLVRGIGSGGQHRPSPAPPLPRPRKPPGRRRAAVAPALIVEPQRAAQWLTRGLAGVIILGLALMIGFLVTGPDRRQQTSGAAAAPALDSLTLGEIFPDQDDLRPAGATGAYRIEMRHFDTDCREATTGELGALLARNGCSEVARAGLTSPYGGYRVTAGVFTLADAQSAATVNDLVREQVVSGAGGFTTIPAGAGGDPATASIGWHVRENFLLYCVITRPDGTLVHDDDPYAKRITAEIVDNHLGGVLSGRAAPPQPPGSLL
ncbi:hypothetical protein JIG36_26920 [Actinoplanes sp. LDG1-06]|uniref:Uncharacterized protein n=1 Tax=Paractinoplanes ovalisporus TaxID=2810368 RepID=A0ABS2AHC8_9ACTN|nr:hypothetical protein [Actinoplanes ovalisporus]MBM2619190.1 hypothetical protein [Actinoplanes ovalisporus]